MHPYLSQAVAEQRTADMLAAAERGRRASAAKKAAQLAPTARPADRRPLSPTIKHRDARPAAPASAGERRGATRREDELVRSAAAGEPAAPLCTAGR